MALFIEGTNNGIHFQHQVHVGESYRGRGKVTDVQADGDELEWIRDDIVGIPMTNARVVCWQGDIANFIANNWSLNHG